jgi:hypothetical protein
MKKLNPARLFLYDYLELNVLEKDLQDWNHQNFEKNPPRNLRLIRMNACLAALNIKITNWNDFQKGNYDYLSNQVTNQMRVVKLMRDLLKNKSEKFDFKIDEDGFDKSYFFYMALSMRKFIYQFEGLHKTVLAASGNYILPLFIINNILHDLDYYSKQLDKIIFNLLNPSNKFFERKTMIQEFGFPNVDIKKIDLDWI